ncbi:MAG TPA: hypothetical protein VIU38_13695 [Anaerolineales bacterium]
MPVSRWRTAICVLLAAASVTMLAWASWPPPRATGELAISQRRVAEDLFDPQSGFPNAPPSSGDASEIESFTVSLNYPTQMRVGDSWRVWLHVSPPTDTAVGSAPTTEEARLQEALKTERLVAEARLELPGADVRPREAVNQYASSGRAADFVWSAVLAEPIEARGTVWLSLIVKDAQSGQQSRATISAQPMETRGATVLGLSGPMARAVAGLGILAAGVIGFPLAANMIGRLSAPANDQSK